MPTIRHPNGTTAVVSEKVLPFWTGPAGWSLAEESTPAASPPKAAPRPRRRRARPPAPTTTPAPTVGAPDDDPGLGSSTTTPKE
jgi:hypothetical protein